MKHCLLFEHEIGMYAYLDFYSMSDLWTILFHQYTFIVGRANRNLKLYCFVLMHQIIL